MADRATYSSSMQNLVSRRDSEVLLWSLGESMAAIAMKQYLLLSQ
jgi:hypothetical protein